MLHQCLQELGSNQSFDSEIIEMVMTQLSLNKALKICGNDTKKAVKAKIKQLHWRESFKPVRYNELTPTQRQMSLETHIFVTKKRSGELKARQLAGGNTQRDFISKEEVSSPTALQDSIILSSIINAMEEQEVAIVDIPNAFVQTIIKDEKDKAIIRIRG